ncbi:MAG: universal stress protein [Cyanobacteriota bacterium]
MYHHLLVPTDGTIQSTTCITHAVELARAVGARITIFHARESPYARTAVLPYGLEAVAFDADLTARFEASRRERADQLLAEACAIATAAGVSAEADSVEADCIWRAILDAATRHGCDLIVMASHGRAGLAGLLVGSETLRVLTHSRIPVLVDRPSQLAGAHPDEVPV